MKKLIIFGIGEQAEMAYYYFKHDSSYKITAFTVDKEYIEKETLFDLPIIEFGSIESKFSKDDHELFIAVGYNKINKLRTEKYIACKNKGYKIASYISTKASVFTDNIGENVFVLEDNTIQPYVRIGNNVTLWSGNHIGHHSIIEDNCFITSHVVISGGCKIGENSFIGVNATLRDHIKIGKSNVIGAGALILGDTEDNKVYMEIATEASRVPSNRLRGI
ncbi:acetyltransferase [Arcobacter sp.]|uniref:acetyltransferase n=1 Tax=unclassified Arcobacter TaxID=2593671 RepID=UPI003B007936|eukprot:TRINITY_DN3055_c0_g1_i1.p1 TRINITY_DN3055_c0_g1~~TRINITY_DN3055_c0_g1_i1.p1  ORF type:complete len:220 (+),score=-47.39 TRINITY_DN3055_c0_g1_i1:76-735(+)